MSVVDYLSKMPPQEFEKFVATVLLPKLGFKDVKWVGGPSDRGADVLAKLEEIDGIHSYVIQVKRYTNTKVGEQTVMLLHSTMQALNCDRGIVITTSDFTVDAVEVAKKLGVRLINGLQLAKLIQQYQVPIPLTAPQEQAEEEDRAPVPQEELVEEKVEDSFYSRLDPEDALAKAKDAVKSFGNAKLKSVEAVMRRLYVYQVKATYFDYEDRRRRTKTFSIAVDDEGENMTHVLEYLIYKRIEASKVNYVRNEVDAKKLAEAAERIARSQIDSPIIEVSKELKKRTWYLEEYKATFYVGLTEVVASVREDTVIVAVKPIDENALKEVAMREVKKVTSPKGQFKVARTQEGYEVSYEDEDYVVRLKYDDVGTLLQRFVSVTQSKAVKLALTKVKGEVVKVEGYTVFINAESLYSCKVDPSGAQVDCSVVGVSKEEALKVAMEAFTEETKSTPKSAKATLKENWVVEVEGVTGRAVVEISLGGKVLSLKKEAN